MRLEKHSENQLEEGPLFRKVVTPWYDSNLLCCLTLFAMLLFALFSWAGIYVARQHPLYGQYIWVPATLVFLSLGVAFSLLVRLARRFFQGQRRYSDL